MKSKTLIGTTIAAVALAFATVPVSSFAAKSSKVPCYGVTSCKGKSACKVKKGKGYVMTTKANCKKMHGSTKKASAS